MPLYLLILVIIAVVAIALVLNLFNQVQPPTALGDVVTTPANVVVTDPDGDDVWTTDRADLLVVVTDTSGDRVRGATVSLSGNNVQDKDGKPVHGVTGAEGSVQFKDLHLEVVGTPHPLDVKVEKPGLGERTTSVPVVKG